MKDTKAVEHKKAQQRALKNKAKKNPLRAKNPMPVYKSGFMNGKHVDYSKMQKGIISSLD